MKEIKKNKGALIGAIALLLVAVVACVAWFTLRPEANEGAKTLTVQVVHGDGTSKDFTLHTDAEYLGQALEECEEMAVVGQEGEFGLFITSVDGEEASDADHTFWSVSCNGEDLMVGVDLQPVADGESYALTLTEY